MIFHAVEQLKLLQSEEDTRSSTLTTNTWSSPIGLTAASQESSTTSAIQSSSDESEGEENESNDRTEEPVVQEASTNETEIETADKTKAEDQEVSKVGTSESKIHGTNGNEKMEDSKTQEALKNKIQETSIDDETSKGKTEDPKMESASGDDTETLIAVETSEPGKIDQDESPEVNQETPETNYATPETNYEEPEDVHAVQETNHEVPEEDHERISSPHLGSIVANSDKKKEPTIDSVVRDVYEILKPTPSRFVDAEPLEESKSAVAVSEERLESMEEEEDENRWSISWTVCFLFWEMKYDGLRVSQIIEIRSFSLKDVEIQ